MRSHYVLDKRHQSAGVQTLDEVAVGRYRWITTSSISLALRTRRAVVC